MKNSNAPQCYVTRTNRYPSLLSSKLKQCMSNDVLNWESQGNITALEEAVRWSRSK